MPKIGSVKKVLLKFPYFLALDLDNKNEAMALAKKVCDFVGGFKVGSRLSLKYGTDFISELAKLAPVFIDNKYYDIPTTMEAAVRASFLAGASYCTVHGGCGLVALKKMSQLEKELSKTRPFKILAVTVLTSFDLKSRPSHWKDMSLSEITYLLAADIKRAGLTGLVCSAKEARSIKNLYPKFYLVVPGIRLSQNRLIKNEDQKQTMEPNQALREGADALVIGRLILESDTPKKMAIKLSESLIK